MLIEVNYSMIKKITGSWFEFQHHSSIEGVYWNETLKDFTHEDWFNLVKEMKEFGMDKLVLMHVALNHKTYYKSKILPQHTLRTENPLETLLSAADKYNMKVFIGNGFWGKWDDDNIILDKDAKRRRRVAFEELLELFGHHPSFYGWYWASEAWIQTYYSEEFINYANYNSAIARKLSPDKKIMIAPCGTRTVPYDDKYLKQLDILDVDIIAYQDEVGCRKISENATAEVFKKLKKAHDKVGKSAIWADVEVFEFEGDVYKSKLKAAPLKRVKKQIEAVSPFVEEILIYQYQGMISNPGTPVTTGHPDSSKLFLELKNL